MTIVIHFDRGIYSQYHRNLLDRPTRPVNHKRNFLSWLDSVFDTQKIKSLAAVESQRSSIRIVLELTRQHAHSDEITAMNTFKALRDDCFDTQQAGTLRSPVARTSGAILLTSDDNERHILGLITHRCIVDTHALAIGMMNGDATFNTRHHQVLDANICERATNHHLVISTPRTVAIEVFDINATLLQV